MNGVHDMGGTDGFGPVIAGTDEPVFHSPWEGRVASLARIVSARGLWSVDAFRHAIERIPPAQYLASGYYERWLLALVDLIAEAGVASRGELDAIGFERRLPPASKDPPTSSSGPEAGPPRFALGDRVRARIMHPAGHTRLPRYARGRLGEVVAYRGAHILADASAHGRILREPLYGVRFAARELWGSEAGKDDSVFIDLWESHIENA
ncbi:MAG: nitrile hydratase subunit beta [Caulobacteraceae bacterium]